MKWWIVPLLCWPMLASAQRSPPPPAAFTEDLSNSAQLTELQKKLKAGDRSAAAAFWKSLTDKGGPLIEARDSPHRLLVTFVYRDEKAKNVALFGLAGGAGPDPLTRLPGTDLWARSYAIRDDARVSYWFASDVPLEAGPNLDFAKVGKRFRPDPLNPRRTGLFQSLLTLPMAGAQPLTMPGRDLPTGEVHAHKITSRKLGNQRRIYVYTPPGYRTDGGPYPLVVLFDGSDYLTEIPGATILDNLIAQKRLPPTIAVMIDPVDRAIELGISEKFTDVVATEIVPWVQKRYHATADPRATVVGGLSLGGLASTYAAFRHPEVFGNVLSQSGSYWWFQEGDDEFEWLTRQIAAAPRKPIRFYLEVGLFEGAGNGGSPGMVLSNRHLRDVLSAKGYPVTFRSFAGGHSSVSWRGTLGDALFELLAGVRPRKVAARPPTGDLLAKDTGLSLLVPVMRAAALDGGEAALQIFRELRDKTDRYDVDERSVNTLGYQLLYGFTQPRAAIALFEDNVRHFPSSGNVYDSLGEAQMVAGDRVHAAQSYKKSLELDPKNANAVNLLEQLSQP